MQMPSLDQTVGQHGVSHFQEAGDVGAGHQVAGLAVLGGGARGVVIKVGHNVLQMAVHLLEGPGHAHGILAHLQGGGGHAAGVGGLGGGKEETGSLQGFHRVGSAGHVGTLGHGEAAVLDQGFGSDTLNYIKKKR